MPRDSKYSRANAVFGPSLAIPVSNVFDQLVTKPAHDATQHQTAAASRMQVASAFSNLQRDPASTAPRKFTIVHRHARKLIQSEGGLGSSCMLSGL
jgi:hypothetical protein